MIETRRVSGLETGTVSKSAESRGVEHPENQVSFE